MSWFSQLHFHAQVRKDTREIVEQINVIITSNKQGGYFPQNPEDGYNAMKEMQQVLLHASRGSRS